MAVLRVNKTKNYTVMSNYHLRDKNLSLKAKGLLSIMLSLPDDWDYSIKGLVAICKEGETAVTSTLYELKEYGYLTVTKIMPNKENGGKYEYIYDIYEQPQENQEVENQGVGFLGVENHPLNKDTTISNSLDNTNNITNKQNKEKEIPPLSPKGKTTKVPPLTKEQMETMVTESDLEDCIKEELNIFVQYKIERGDKYTSTGFGRLIKQVKKYCLSNGSNNVIDCMELSMSNNWQGIIWDKINSQSWKNAESKFDPEKFLSNRRG